MHNSLSKIERLRLHDTVVEHLRTLITEGALPPGTKLNERELCEKLGISRTPLREALKVLAVEGLIVITPNRGASVAQMSDEEISEAFEFMSGMESFAGELACERISEAELEHIESLHEEMAAAKSRGDLPNYYRCNTAIHDQISLAARNTALRQSYLALNRRLQAVRFRSNRVAPKWERALHDHEQMLDALRTRDAKRMSLILRRHLLDARGQQ